MVDERNPARPRQEPPPEFSWLERRADWMLLVMVLTLVPTDIGLYWFRPHWVWVRITEVVAVAAGCVLGVQLGDHLGRGYVGGMFLPRWGRACLCCVLGSALAWPEFYLLYRQRPGPAPARPGATARAGDSSP
jgi:hypothetical protein